MTTTADPVSLALTGTFPFILLLAAVITLPVSIGLLELYRRAVTRSMRSTARQGTQTLGNLSTIKQNSSVITALTARNLHFEVLYAPWRAAAVYVFAGICYALTTTSALVAAGRLEFLPVRFLCLFWLYIWPTVITISLVAASTRRTKLITLTVYFLVLAILGILASSFSGSLFNWGEIIKLWLIFNLPATILLSIFLNSRIRAVGSLVLTFWLFAITGSALVLLLVGSNQGLFRSIANLGWLLGLNAVGTLIGMIILGCAVFGPVGWLVLQWIGKLYERKQISDQSIMLDSIWLLFGLVHSVISLVPIGSSWIFSGLLAFIVYKFVSRVGFSMLNRKARRLKKSYSLLLLRVFSLGNRSAGLFNALSMHWRYIGIVQLIAGPDLLRTTIEPHEFLDFLSRKLARRFIDSLQALDLRLTERDLKPDRDKRFRITDFFCYEDTWKMVLSRLLADPNTNNVVLMDLRSFSEKHQGCIHEIQELINVVPLKQVVFVIDSTTDEQFLHQTLQDAWLQMKPSSPNQLSNFEQIQRFRFTRLHGDELKKLLCTLCTAAETTSLAAA